MRAARFACASGEQTLGLARVSAPSVASPAAFIPAGALLPRWLPRAPAHVRGLATKASSAAAAAAPAPAHEADDESTEPHGVPPALEAARQQRRGRAGGRKKAERAKQLSALLQLPQRVSVMPGIGPKYEQLLKQHSISTVDDLMKVHVLGHGRSIDATAQFLKDKVGINNAGCVRSITGYLAQQQQNLDRELQQWVQQQQQEQGLLPQPGGQQQQERPGMPSWLQPKVTLSVEGNISAGKSTFLRILEGKGMLDSKLQVVPEPLHKWQNVGEEGRSVNLLMEFYRAPERFAYTFQNYVFLTRMMQERESYTAAAMCRLLERSVFSDKMVFVRSVHAAHYMSDTELAIYNSWFDPVLSTLPTLVPNGFIYLRASPQTCHKRLQRRARREEDQVQLEYLQDLHSKHEDWLYEGGDPVPASTSATGSDKYIWVGPSRQVLTSSSAPPAATAAMGGPMSHLRPGISFSIHDRLPSWASHGSPSSQQHQQQQQGEALVAASRLPPVPKELDRAIRFLDTSRGAHMHPLLHTIPALVLDCDTDVDVDRDEAYKAHIAGQVSMYCDYVRQYMVARADAVVGHEQRSMAAAAQQQQPSAGGQGQGVPGVWFPPTGQFNGYSLDVKGTTLYVDPAAPLVAYATPQAQQLASSSEQQLTAGALSKARAERAASAHQAAAESGKALQAAPC